MGAKISVDSSSLMNKGLEMIEAKWLFNLTPEQIDVIVHPQSIVHSLIQFTDGSMKAQMGLPDMKLPIQFALTYPNRFETTFPRFDFMDYPNLTFEKADLDVFRNLNLAYAAMRQEGVAACYLNAANEIAVDAFLNDKIQFVDIFRVNEETVVKSPKIVSPVYEDYVSSDREARILAAEICSRLN
jgi:1-deoxy-D-xylulose-5-phosphate reductoisomerase